MKSEIVILHLRFVFGYQTPLSSIYGKTKELALPFQYLQRELYVVQMTDLKI